MFFYKDFLKTIKPLFLGFFFVVFAFIFVACSLGSNDENLATRTDEPKNTNWYICTEKGIIPSTIEEITTNDASNVMPWVQAYCITGTWTNKKSLYFLINRWGVADFSLKKGFSENKEANPDFLTVTSTDIFLINKIPFFRQYRDTFFQTENSTEHPSIMKWKVASKTGEAVIYPKNLDLANNFEATNSFIKNDELFITFKSSSKTKTEFEYKKIPLKNLESFSDKTYTNEIVFSQEIPAGTYRTESSPLPLSKISKRFVDLVKQFDEISFSLSYRDETQEICSQQNFLIGTDPKLTAYGLSTENTDAILFEDGTFLIKIFDKSDTPHFLKAKLPRPSDNLVYTGLAIKDSYLFGIWEEQFFFNRGKCGLYVNKLGI